MKSRSIFALATLTAASFGYIDSVYADELDDRIAALQQENAKLKKMEKLEALQRENTLIRNRLKLSQEDAPKAHSIKEKSHPFAEVRSNKENPIATKVVAYAAPPNTSTMHKALSYPPSDPERAKAADRGDKIKSLDPVKLATVTWGGSYYGLNLGYAHLQDRLEVGDWNTPGNPFFINPTSAVSATTTNKANGINGGAQIGYNSIIEKKWLAGLELDFQSSSTSGGHDYVGRDGNITTTTHSSLDWFGTLRSRVGFVNEAELLYLTAGGVLAHTTTSVLSNLDVLRLGSGQPHPNGLINNSNFRAGWVLGSGYERWVTDSISLRLEYLHLFLGQADGAVSRASNSSSDNTRYSSKLMYDIVRVGINFKLPPVP